MKVKAILGDVMKHMQEGAWQQRLLRHKYQVFLLFPALLLSSEAMLLVASKFLGIKRVTQVKLSVIVRIASRHRKPNSKAIKLL